MRIRTTAVVVTSALAGLMVPARPAYADAVPVRYQATGAYNPVGAKSVAVRCPAGTSVLGTGGEVNGGGGKVVLTGIVPDTALTTVTVSAVARTGQPDGWSITAYAVCRAPGLYEPVRVASSGLLWNASATCPVGKQVTGAGFAILNATGSAFLDRLKPSTGLTHVDVHARGVAIGADNLMAYAICAVPVDQAERTEATADSEGGASTSAVAGQPLYAPGGTSRTYTVGGEITGGGQVHLDALVPNPALDTARARAVVAPAPPAAGTTFVALDDAYSVTAFGLCIGSWY